MKFRPMNIEYLNKVLTYNPESGLFTWNYREVDMFNNPSAVNPWNARHAGKIAGSVNKNGYVKIFINGKALLAHRIAWAMNNQSEIPDGMVIDHINHDPSDNRIVNLRVITSSENARNMRLSDLNTSGYHGVYFCKRKQKWAAQIKIDGLHKHLGYFSDIEDAVAKRRSVEKSRGFHENHGKTRDLRRVN